MGALRLKAAVVHGVIDKGITGHSPSEIKPYNRHIARKLLPESPDHKLETLADHLGLEEAEHHRALPDAVWCWKVLEACLERSPGQRSPAGLLTLQGGTPITLGSCAPRPGRALKPRLRSLERACAARERVTLLYGGASAAPVPLQVVPWLLYAQAEHSYLEAECCSSGVLKTYRLDRIQRVLV